MIQNLTELGHENNLSYVLQIEKVLKWTTNSFVTLSRNLYDSFSTLRIFSADVSIHNYCKGKLVQNNPIFFHSIHTWNNDSTTNFMIFGICLFLLEF